MNRRKFLKAIACGAVATALVPVVAEAVVDPFPAVVAESMSVHVVETAMRFDVLYGFACISPSVACRIAA